MKLSATELSSHGFRSDSKGKARSPIDSEIVGMYQSIRALCISTNPALSGSQGTGGQTEKDIDLEVIRLQGPIRVLKSSRNTLSTIFKLPCELLTTIFMDVLLTAVRPNSCLLIRVAQVCRRWRQIAINYPLLWTRFDLTHDPHPDVVLRSTDRAIFLQISIYPLRSPKSTEAFIITNGHRVQEVNIKASATSFLSIVGSFRNYAPLLQVANFRTVSQQEYQLDILEMLTGFFEGHIPRLRKLSLGHLPIYWGWQIFSQLTHLQIEGNNEPGLLATLAGMSNIISLELIDSIPEYFGTIEHSTVVSVPTLCELKLERSLLPHCSFFVNHLHLSPKVHISMNIPSISWRVFKHPISLPSAPSNYLEVVWEEWEVRFITPLVVVAFSGIDPSLAVQFFTTALHVLGHSNTLKRLHLKMIERRYFLTIQVTSQDWVSLLIQMERLECLEMDFKGSGRTLLRALTPVVQQLVGGATNICLPGLHKIVVRFEESDGFEAHFNLMHNLLRSRQQLGYKLWEVDVTDHTERLTLEQTEVLKGLVGVLRWECGVVDGI